MVCSRGGEVRSVCRGGRSIELTSKRSWTCQGLLGTAWGQILKTALAGDQLIHSLFRDPGPNWSAEGVSYNGETDQIEALHPTILCLWVVFDPDHILGLQAILLAHRRREMLGVIGNRSAAILWHFRRDEDILPVVPALHLNIAGRIAAPESLVVVLHSRQPPPSAYPPFGNRAAVCRRPESPGIA